jgi:hypothetical protein
MEVRGCNGNYYWTQNLNTYTTPGIYRDTVVAEGCDTIYSINIVEFQTMELITKDTTSINSIDLTAPGRTEGSIFPPGTILRYYEDPYLIDTVVNPHAIINEGVYYIYADNGICMSVAPITLNFCNVINNRTNVCSDFAQSLIMAASGDTLTLYDEANVEGFTIPANKTITVQSQGFNASVFGELIVDEGSTLNWIGEEDINLPNTPGTPGTLFIINNTNSEYQGFLGPRLTNNGIINIKKGSVHLLTLPNLTTNPK